MKPKSTTPTTKYGEGDAFAVPLQSGGYALGVIARHRLSRRSVGRCIVGYFFGPRLREVPNKRTLEALMPGNVDFIWRFGDLGLHEGTWPVIGNVPNWDRSRWPMPTFYRQQLVSGTRFKVVYDDDDPSRVLSETETNEEIFEKPPDGLFGAGAVERALDTMLEKLQ